jgi:hypothetical protein
LRIGFTIGLFAGLERERFGKLDCHAPQEPAYLVNSADMTATGEVGHIKRVVWPQTRHAEASRYVLAGIRTTVVGVARKCRSAARNINHLTL